MHKVNLTDLKVKNLKSVSGKRTEMWDGLLPGFGVRVSPKGTKSFILMYRFNGKLRRQTLGRYPILSLSVARQKAQDILLKASHGDDPADMLTDKRKAGSFSQILEDFLKLHCQRHNKPSTQASTRRLLVTEFLPDWEKRVVRGIRKRDILVILDRIVERGSPGAANHAYSAISKFFSWCSERDLIDSNPCSDVKRPSKLKARDRVLSDTELAAIWHGADEQTYPYGDIVKLLMLTGQRRGEVVGIHWQHVDLEERVWSIPKEMTKSSRAHQVPLSPALINLLRALPRLNERYLFPSHGKADTVFSGFGKAKKRLDETCAIKDWTLHDLRRTAATGMAGLGIQPHVVEKVLNHSSGTFSGVAGVYNRFAYLDEMRKALIIWENHVMRLVSV